MGLFDTEKLKKTYFSLALPVVMGLLVTLIYSLADTYFITATGDENLIAGVSLCAPLFTALMAFGNIFGQGGSSLISRLLGEQDEENVKRVSSFSFYVSIAVGVVLAILLMLFRSPVLTMIGAREATMVHARNYYTVLSLGAPLVVLNFIHANLLRCEGFAKESMCGNILGSVVNILLDPILISVLHMGTLGAALATVIGYAFAVTYLLLVVRKKSKHLSVSLRDCGVTGPQLASILGVGISAALSNLMSSCSVVLLNNALLSYGSTAIAAMGIVSKICMIPNLILTGFAFGSVPLFGYLYGSGNKENVRELTRFIILFMSCLAIGASVLLIAGRMVLLKVFTADAVILTMGGRMLLCQVLGTEFAALVLFFTVMFQATGKALPALIMSVSRQGVVFVICLFVLRLLFAFDGILMAQPLADILSAALGFFIYRKTFRK